MSSREPPRPWNMTIAGQPPAGGVPLGRKSVAASGRPSSAVIFRSWRPNALADPAATSATRRRARSAGRSAAGRRTSGKGRGTVTGWCRTEVVVASTLPRRGPAADRRVRLRRGRADRAARVPRHAAARGLRLPRRRRAAALRAAAARRDPPLRPRDRPVTSSARTSSSSSSRATRRRRPRSRISSLR